MYSRIGLIILLAASVMGQNEKCDNEKCGWGATCKMVNGRPMCKCNEFCPMVHKPVCGSDGKTYTNYCGMKQAGCHQQEEIVKMEDGECPKIVTESSTDDLENNSTTKDQDLDQNTEEILLVPGELKKQQQKPR